MASIERNIPTGDSAPTVSRHRKNSSAYYRAPVNSMGYRMVKSGMICWRLYEEPPGLALDRSTSTPSKTTAPSRLDENTDCGRRSRVVTYSPQFSRKNGPRSDADFVGTGRLAKTPERRLQSRNVRLDDARNGRAGALPENTWP